MSSITAGEFTQLKDYLYTNAGIDLGAGKEYLVSARLTEVCKVLEIGSISALIKQLRSRRTVGDAVVEAMTTNETSFFRDTAPFEALRTQILPELIKARSGAKTLKIWSAACSTGQEPYSLGIMIRENFPQLANWKIEILATDIAENKVIEKAKAGEYSQLEVSRGLQARLLVKYFKQKGRMWKVNSDLRDMVRFRKVNLLEVPSFLGTFDLLLCRNVLIYFDNPTKKRILDSLQKHLAKDGFLMLGGSELLMGLTKTLTRRALGRTTCYQHAGG